MKTFRIATRGSDLALWQARDTARRIEAALGYDTELLVLKTTGDRLPGPLAAVGGKGLFVKEIEDALLEGRADLAVHSAKDLPAASPPELTLAAFPERTDPRDAVVARQRGATLATLPRGARVGTGSVRRAAQLRHFRSDLEVVPLRGNVPTRLKKLEGEKLDAVILACAGLERLDLAERIDERVAPEVMLPAVGQGTLALQIRRGDPLGEEVSSLNHATTARRIEAERAFLTRLGGDCDVPLAAFAEESSAGRLRVRGLVIALDGGQLARATVECDADGDPARAGSQTAEAVLRDGGDAILKALRAEAAS